MDLVRQILTIGALFVWHVLLLYVYKELYAPRLPMKLLLPLLLVLSIVAGVQLG
ncbi:hypothetical protein Pogu_1946 [Pyrobaculum oguniense TE7]|uniref:Uncharacterized protein n=1 Tax=Pyrobaculum oguniense (strain DSM 13380 / JCM 10595 / TE7) TaxID=698757 RepID=H6QCK5_PYROT|nr:hypothetical protein Pogu_1946 [Pyrobaculum oguniense TE7]